MIDILLQFSGLGIGVAVGIVLGFVSAILGVIITYIAFEGYRRNGSRPMLFVAVGFFFVFALPFFLSIGPKLAVIVMVTTGELRGIAPFIARISAVVGFVVEVSRVVGLLSILYGLRMPLRR